MGEQNLDFSVETGKHGKPELWFIEDHEHSRESLIQLSKMIAPDFEPIGFSNAKEGVDRLEQIIAQEEVPPFAIFIDGNLVLTEGEYVSGEVVVEKIREILAKRPEPKVVIVAISNDPDLNVKMKEKGANYKFSKMEFSQNLMKIIEENRQ